MTSHRQGYPFQGCVPTEPWSVSPCADIELYSRLDKQMTFRAYAWKNPGGSGAKPLRDTAIVSMFPASISFRCSKSFLNKKEDKLNTVATQRSGTRFGVASRVHHEAHGRHEGGWLRMVRGGFAQRRKDAKEDGARVGGPRKNRMARKGEAVCRRRWGVEGGGLLGRWGVGEVGC